MAREPGKLWRATDRIAPARRAPLDSFRRPVQRSTLVTIDIVVRPRSEDARCP